MGSLCKKMLRSPIGTLSQLAYMPTASRAPGRLRHVDQHPAKTKRRDVGIGILALGDAVHICVVDGSHEWGYEEREGIFYPTNAPANARWCRVHIAKSHVFRVHSHLVHAGAPGGDVDDDDPLGFDVATTRVHFLVNREDDQEEGGACPVAWPGENHNESTRVEAHDDSSTGASAAPRDSLAAAAATGDGPRDLSAFLEDNGSRAVSVL